MIVKHRNMKGAEKILEAIARKCSEVLQLKNCVLMFDDTKRVVQEEQFTVGSARPTFGTTDDAFVEIAAKLSEPTIFVTSDRELIRRLQEAGKANVTICKPKSWFQFLAHLLGGLDSNEMSAIDSWYAEAWVSNTIAH
jgi:rRNA-processing protein FCF1